MSFQKDTLTLNAGLVKFKEAELNKQLEYPVTDYWSPRLSYNGYLKVILKDNNHKLQKTYNCLGIEKEHDKGKWKFIVKLSEIN